MRGATILMGAMFCLCAGIALVYAQSAPLAKPLAAPDPGPRSAIGQISYGEKTDGAICTGTLVAPDVVLTAGHCVAMDGVAMRAGAIKFSAGKNGPDSAAVRYGREIILMTPPEGEALRMRYDIALLVLNAPIGPDVALPLPLVQKDAVTDRYSFIGYRRNARDLAVRTDDCSLVNQRGRVLGLTCAVTSGNSGSPLLVQNDGGWQVAAVIVSQGTGSGDIQSYAVMPDDDFRTRIETP